MILPVLLPTNNINLSYIAPFKSKAVSNVKTTSRFDSTPQKHAKLPVTQSYIKVSPVSTTIVKSKNSYNVLKAKLDSIFFDYTKTDKRNPSNALGTIEYNKARYDAGIHDITRKKIRTGSQAKQYINDNNLISARIVLNNGTKSEGNRVLSRIQQAIKKRQIIVREVSMYGINDTTDYVSYNKLGSIVEESNNLGLMCMMNANRIANGFHGISIKVQLEDGLMGTLEVMGPEVAKIKDVHDVLTSIKNNCTVDEKYSQLKEEYSKLDSDALLELDSYIQAAYINARSNEIFNNHSDSFLPLPVNSSLPECFNINRIAKL